AALARFDELNAPTPRLENTASHVIGRYLAYFATRDWDVMRDLLAEDFSGDDRRRVVNGGIRHGREAEISNVRAIAEIGCEDISSIPVATRGERLVLARHAFTVRDWPEPFDNEMIDVVEIDSDSRLAAEIVFDSDDIDSAIAELDARYLAGEAADHAPTWSVIARTYAGFNRGELPVTTQDWVNIDRRRVTTMAPGDGIANLRASWALPPDWRLPLEAGP